MPQGSKASAHQGRSGHAFWGQTSQCKTEGVNGYPTIVRDGQFRLFFFSREEARIHVHVAHPDGEAKFWLTPQVAVANHTGLSAKQLREAQSVAEKHIEEIQSAWNCHFGS